MRTPAGNVCTFYYEDLHRGAGRRECRAPRAARSLEWRLADCARCPVPEILRCAGGPDLGVRVMISALPLGLGRRVRAECWCDRHLIEVARQLEGCPACRAEVDGVLRGAIEADEPPADERRDTPSD